MDKYPAPDSFKIMPSFKTYNLKLQTGSAASVTQPFEHLLSLMSSVPVENKNPSSGGEVATPCFPSALWTAVSPELEARGAGKTETPYALNLPLSTLTDRGEHLCCESRKCLQKVAEWVDAEGGGMAGFVNTRGAGGTKRNDEYRQLFAGVGEWEAFKNPAFFPEVGSGTAVGGGSKNN